MAEAKLQENEAALQGFTRLTGLTAADLRAMQDLLVRRAKEEREALRAETGSNLTRSVSR